MKGKILLFIAGVIVFIFGLVLGWLIPDSLAPSPLSTPSLGQVRVNLPQFKLINPLLFSENEKSNDSRFQAFAKSVDAYVVEQKKDTYTDASMYFRDLNTGQWTGVNEDDLYSPSSMLKVVAMMAALKLAEANPEILSEKLHYIRPSTNSPFDFRAPNTVNDGYYSLQDLIGFMIKYSDNGAFDAVVSDKKINAEFVQIYSLFRLPPGALSGTINDFMSPRSYSYIFRALYNSSFFEWNLSEQVLDLLTQTTFSEGLVGGVPDGTVVAHKFGENTNELHDCGIVYYPKHPYLLCIMTRGGTAKSLGLVIQHISKMAWDYADQGGLINN